MFELCLRVTKTFVDPLSDALMDIDALSVSVEDADALTAAEQALFAEPGMPEPQMGWARSVVTALFATRERAKEVAQWLQTDTEWGSDLSVLHVRAVPDQDWVRLTQSQFEPVHITPEFWIVPSWHEPPEGAKRVLRLDPGLAFGTGTHPTTQMCLKWIALHGQGNHNTNGSQSASLGERVLDYGCGSGILAMGAALFGALQIDAVDIDAAALSATKDNAQANQLAALIHTGLPEHALGEYDTVLANILASPLKVLAPLLVGHVRSGGNLVLSGILERQVDELTQTYAPYCTLSVLDTQEGWVLMGALRLRGGS